jgi:hypothetical protein
MPTAFTKLVGCWVPVQLAAMGGRHGTIAGRCSEPGRRLGHAAAQRQQVPGSRPGAGVWQMRQDGPFQWRIRRPLRQVGFGGNPTIRPQ